MTKTMGFLSLGFSSTPIFSKKIAKFTNDKSSKNILEIGLGNSVMRKSF